MGAKRILEIGTLGGYSAIWMARALPPGGQLISLEYSPKHAEVARSNLARAGLAQVAEVRVGPGLELLPSLSGQFDFFFIDADKERAIRTISAAVSSCRDPEASWCSTTSCATAKLSIESQHRFGGAGRASTLRDIAGGAARRGNVHSDGWREGLRRLLHGRSEPLSDDRTERGRRGSRSAYQITQRCALTIGLPAGTWNAC